MKIQRVLAWSFFALVSGFVACEQCTSPDNESVLHTNNAYTYRFRSVALAQAVGTTEDESRIVLQCDAHVSHDHACIFNLELQKCEITASGGQPGLEKPWLDRRPLPDLSKYHVAFSLVNGKIDYIKAHEDEPLYYLNIKRGVLSAFVFKLSQTRKELQEVHTDVHGDCPLTSVPVEGSDETVKTSKDMLQCHFPSRPDWQFSPWSLFWNMSFIQYVINSTTDCDYEMSTAERRIEKVFCKERHAIMLESTHRTTTAVQTNIYYYMDFMKSEVQTSKHSLPVLSRKTDIRFEYEDTPVPLSSPPNFLPVAEKMMSDLVLDSVDEVRLFTIPQFTNFVAWIRASHDLTELVDSVKTCAFLPDGMTCNERMKELAMSYFSDALIQCNNLPCAKAITYLARTDDLSPVYLNIIFHSWSYMHYSKPGFVTNFMDICKLKNSELCWMSLGNFVYRIYSRNGHLDDKVLEEAKEFANHIHSRIEEDCEELSDSDNPSLNCLAYMKAVSNVGKYYVHLIPNGVSLLLDYATNDHSPIFVRTSALEAIRDVYNSENKEQNRMMYDNLLPLLKNSSLPASLRILAYEQLILVSDGYHFEEHLINILKDEHNVEIRFYVAKSLNSLRTDYQFITKREQFIKSLNELLAENNLSLEWMLFDSKGQSHSSTNKFFLNLPFMPDSMKRFGLKVEDSAIYDSPIYPTIFNQNSILQLFSAIFPATKLGSYFEGWEEILLMYQKNLGDMNSKSSSFSDMYAAILKTLGEYGLPDDEGSRSFDENIIKNVKKLQDLYWQHHKKIGPYAKAYFDLFGSTVKYFTLEKLQSPSANKEIIKLIRSLKAGMEEGMTYNTTRVIRVIEAYHQVPTMMGLPLNWTTNATLAFSVQTGMKFQQDEANQIFSKVFLRPSAALTFLNRMVLDFPTLTQIGIQANSSGYTSTEFKFQYNSSKGKQTLRFERPSRTQKVLELFRTNQIIKHNDYIDIPDWDIERTSSSWCTKDGANSVAGLKFCLTKSYPNVTHRIKPWALMAGWCKWQFLIHPADNLNEVYYDMELQQAEKQKLKEYAAKFSMTGSGKDKSAHFKAAMDENRKDMKFEMKTSMMPDFSASLVRNEVSNHKVSGYKIEGALKLFKDFKYELMYSNEGQIKEPGSTKSSVPHDENNQVLTNDEVLSLLTPYAEYKWNKTILKQGENTKAEAALTYENLGSKESWMKRILPPFFWENDKKASFRIHLNWKKPIYASDTVTRQTEFRLTVPRYVMTLAGDSIKMKNREQINVNLAKVDINRGELDAFLNFTYDFWKNEATVENEKAISVINITIPQRSWSLTYQKLREYAKYQHEVKLKKALMKPNNDVKSNYVGWWSSEISDRFRVEEQEIKLVAHTDFQSPSNSELLDKYSTLTSEDIEGVEHSDLIVSNIVLQYPFYGRMESLDFDGYFIISSGRLPFRLFRFQKDFVLSSSYNNLQLTSHSVYKSGPESTKLNHSSYFTHTTSQTKAYNTIHYTRIRPEGKCPEQTFKHDIRSHVFDLSTNVSYKCAPGDDNLYTLLLTLYTNSSKWDMLNMKLDQIIQDVSPDYSHEDCTVTHPAGTIHVDAEWHGKKESQKRVVICSKKGKCPNFELLIESFQGGKRAVKISVPNQNETQISYERQLSSDYKNLHVKVGYSSRETVLTDFIDFTGEIIARNYHVWKGMIDVNTYNKVKNLFMSGYESAKNTIVAVAKDKDHPLNEILKPALKTTLYDYWKSLKTEVNVFFSTSWSEIKEIVYTLEAFAEPAYVVLTNSVTSIKDQCQSIYNAIKDRSVTIWAVNYFNIPYYLQNGFTNLSYGLSQLMQQLTLGEENLLQFKFLTGKMLSLRSFRDFPSISYYPLELNRILHLEEERSTPVSIQDKEKVASIFGPDHVYTFDGLVYRVPEYPAKDCMFLLAHDVHRSLFSVLSSEKSLHILFPEMSVTINEHNEVFINGSQQSSSLPIQAYNGKVSVKGGHVVEVWSPSLTVICNSRDFLCVFRMSKRHSGGVMGLLGNADDYLNNEYMLPTGSITSELLEFVRSYEVSSRSECKHLALNSELPLSDKESQVCPQRLGSICYWETDVRQGFLKACESDVRTGRGPCYAASGLSATCQSMNKIYELHHTNCNVKGQQSEKIGHNLEVVLVVQQSKYLASSDKANSPVKGIESIIQAIDTKFRDNGYNSVKFSLVGFGGNGVRQSPTAHSVGKDIWVPADVMIRDGLKTLEFKSKEEANPVEALKFALDELGYDTFDSKIFVVIAAKDKQVVDFPLTDDIQRQVEQNGITLYTVSSYPSIEKGKKVYGVRADGLLFPSQAKGGEAYLNYPRGSLAKLTSSTRGSVFLSKFLRENHPPSYFGEFAQEVWAKVRKETQKCRSCRLFKSKWWWYVNQCNIVDC